MTRALALTLLCLASAAHATSWPVFRRTAARTGYASESAAPPLILRWQKSVPGGFVSSPVAGYDRVYIGSRSSSAYCFDAYTGDPLWSHAFGDWVDGSPALSSGAVFVAGRDGKLKALDAFSGALRWTHDTGTRDAGSPFVSGGELYAVTGFPVGRLIALDAASGSLKRSVDLPQFSVSSPTRDPDTGSIFVGSTDGKYMGYSAALTSLWPAPVQTRGSVQMAVPAFAGGRLIAIPGSDDWRARALAGADGSEAWASGLLSADSSQPTSVAVGTDTVLGGGGHADHSLYAMTLSSGGVRWKVSLGQATDYGIASSPALANDVAYVLSPAGELYGVHTGTGGVVVKAPLSGAGLASPAVANGWVYAATMAGEIYGFEAQRAASIQAPDALLDKVEGLITVRGTAASPSLSSWRLEYGTGTAPALWTLLAEGDAQVVRGVLGTWDTREFPPDTYTLRLAVTESPASGFLLEARHAYEVLQAVTVSVSSSSGGTCALTDGVDPFHTEVDIPPGALEGSDVISCGKVAGTGIAAASLNTRLKSLGIVREFKLAGNPRPRFLKPVTLKIPYVGSSPSNENNLRIFWFDEDANKWQTVNTSEVKKDERRVWATTDHFTVFSVMEFSPSSTLLEEAEVYSAPNPARGSSVVFKYRVWDTADISIRIHDVAGTLVADLSGPQVLGGTIGSVTWDISGRATGIYIFTVEARGADGKKTKVTKKMAIIH
ncbi:MAG: PQQ-binding-like beta-propeller repeat protein [Elusimicrobiota bacterium]|jgi:outer membrane protein assembly factor BamB